MSQWVQKLRCPLKRERRHQGRNDTLLGAKRELIKESVLHSSQENAVVRCDRNSKASALRFENLWVDDCVAR